MNSRRRRLSSPTSPATTPPLEDENLLLEILLRLSPLPSSLPRASLVCKRWRRLVSDPKFFRRFCAHHRKAPFLGFFIRCVDGISFKPMLPTPDHIPPSRFCLPQSRYERWDFVGCRNGLALLINQARLEAVVWDPITRHQLCVAFPPDFDERYARYVRNAALLCASSEIHDQVHGRCGLHPFKLVLVQGTGRVGEPQRALVYLYDSESGVWENSISAATKHGIHVASTNVLVGNAVYWLLNGGEILEFDFERQSLVVIDRPAAVPSLGEKHDDFQILRTREHRLGFAMWTEVGIEIWERKGNSDSVAGWERQDIIKFDKLPPLVSRKRFSIAGFDEDSNAIFLSTIISHTFMVQLESMQFRKISIGHYGQVYPYTNFCTAGREISDGSRVELMHNTSDYIPVGWIG
ncbi:uncharacterized protein LOC124695028 [Lolium rigidum]|uniref:uncharacterized protein LOC124695028 n=1 Tax=Lolium rigidum TaxID=89674 RepID=UPI001F5D5AD7|nr:uncharacterized protein LOC124695028 [Lolium rigidum]